MVMIYACWTPLACHTLHRAGDPIPNFSMLHTRACIQKIRELGDEAGPGATRGTCIFIFMGLN